MDFILKFIDKNGLVFAFLIVGIIMYIAEYVSVKVTKGKIPSPVFSILTGLILAYIGGNYAQGQKGLSDIKLFNGIGILGGNMFRDLAIIATAIGASIVVIKKAGWIGAISLLLGVTISFVFGVIIAWLWGYTDVATLTTLGAGACTYIVGPITGEAIGASSEIIALSIATGLVKVILVAIGTPLIAKRIGLNNPTTAMIYGGIIGTNAGVLAGLAATDPKLVPYGAITATFYTGLGCLLCPTVFYILVKIIF